MKVSVLGSLHETIGIKNQDSCLELIEDDRKVKVVCDGCTNIDPNNPETFKLTHSEVGSGLFCSMYKLLDNPFDHEHFIENANRIMVKMLNLIGFNRQEYAQNPKLASFISYNYCFTILACFETKDSFIVYNLGDGAIIVENKLGVITYIEKKYGKYPPYLVLNYLQSEKMYDFEKAIFSKEGVSNVGVASDGIQHALDNSLIYNEAKLNFDKAFKSENSEIWLTNFIKSKKEKFTDDTTIVF